MYARRPLRLGSSALLLTAAFLASPLALAGPEDDRARILARDAMEQDYLMAEFKAALAKLETAVKLCGPDKCNKETLAQVHRALGTVYAAGMNQHEAAVEAFKVMLRNDPAMTPDGNFLTGQVQKAFDEAKAAAPAAPVAVEKAVGVLTETPWTEQATFRPVPVYVELPDAVEASRVVVRYKGPQQKDWGELQLQKLGNGYGGLIPCGAVEVEGELQYFVTAFDANLDRVASAGSAQEPRKVKLVKALSGRQPSLPGGEPPNECPRPEETLSCETNDDCPGTQVCTEYACVDAPEGSGDEEAKAKLNHFSIAVTPDLMLLSGNDNACAPDQQEDGSIGCFYSDGTQYTGPADELDGKIAGGFSLGTLRLTLGYDRVFMDRITAGARLGAALLGPPSRANNDKFVLFHAEVRGAFHLMEKPYETLGVRPYGFVHFGLGSAAAMVGTTIQDTAAAQGRPYDVDAWQTGGNLFAGLGGGIEYAPELNLALRLELGFRQHFPASASVIAPSLGFAYGM